MEMGILLIIEANFDGIALAIADKFNEE